MVSKRGFKISRETMFDGWKEREKVQNNIRGPNSFLQSMLEGKRKEGSRRRKGNSNFLSSKYINKITKLCLIQWFSATVSFPWIALEHFCPLCSKTSFPFHSKCWTVLWLIPAVLNMFNRIPGWNSCGMFNFHTVSLALWALGWETEGRIEGFAGNEVGEKKLNCRWFGKENI